MYEIPTATTLPFRTPHLAHLLVGGGLFCLWHAAQGAWRIDAIPITSARVIDFSSQGDPLGFSMLGWAGGFLLAWLIALVEPTWRDGVRLIGLLACLLMPIISLVRLHRLVAYVHSLPRTRVVGLPEGQWMFSGWLLGGTCLLALAWFVCGQLPPRPTG